MPRACPGLARRSSAFARSLFKPVRWATREILRRNRDNKEVPTRDDLPELIVRTPFQARTERASDYVREVVRELVEIPGNHAKIWEIWNGADGPVSDVTVENPSFWRR